MNETPLPLALIAELTHRCPLACPYCSNPLALDATKDELETADWLRVLDEAAELGVVQVHFSGGEPMARSDLPVLVRHAAHRQLYTNLITSGVRLGQHQLDQLVASGIDHIQISFQDAVPEDADRVAGLDGAYERKLAAARRVVAAGLPLTLNFVVHRENLDRVAQMIALGAELGAMRIEIAHVQYHGWAFANRAGLLPRPDQVAAATTAVAAARARLGDRIAIDYVAPDYYGVRPKACMGGWGRRFVVVAPSGTALPCHAAHSLPGLDFPSVRDASLAAIWRGSAAFRRFRGTEWMPEPCRSCERREIDWGGCRCQAFALSGEAALPDPVCALAEDHWRMAEWRERALDGTGWIYRPHSAASQSARARRAISPRPGS